MTDLVTITVQVPADRVSDLYAYVAQIHRSPFPGNTLPQPWTKEDGQLAQQVYKACSSYAQKVLAYLAERPEQIVSGAEIAQALGMVNGNMAVAGVFVSVSRHCKKFGRELPYDLRRNQGNTAGYIMPGIAAALFKAAVKAAAM